MLTTNLRRLDDALPTTNPQQWLVGYDANEIQALILASSRPLAMLGTSATIAAFDTRMRNALTIFAGGGRGVELASNQEAAKARGERLVSEFRDRTFGGVLATAAVPFDRDDERGSLRWLHMALERAKDAAPPPVAELATPRSRSDECADCHMYTAAHPSQREDQPDERVCRRCLKMVTAGREKQGDLAERIQSLVALGPQIAAVSIDGNNLGDFFSSLDSLAAMQTASEALFELFNSADIEASRHLRHDRVSLATGGDDLRLFLSAPDLLLYIEALVPALERGADELARHPGLRGLAGFGVGIGAVVADSRLPARRLMAHAHDLERSAKRICGPGEARSAIDLAVLTAGTGSIHDPAARDAADRPIAFPRLGPLKTAARRLQDIPGSQRALLAAAGAGDEHEFANLLRYQVARSPQWRAWYTAGGHDWRDPDIVVTERPRAIHFDLARLIGGSDAV